MGALLMPHTGVRAQDKLDAELFGDCFSVAISESVEWGNLEVVERVCVLDVCASSVAGPAQHHRVQESDKDREGRGCCLPPSSPSCQLGQGLQGHSLSARGSAIQAAERQ